MLQLMIFEGKEAKRFFPALNALAALTIVPTLAELLACGGVLSKRDTPLGPCV